MLIAPIFLKHPGKSKRSADGDLNQTVPGCEDLAKSSNGLLSPKDDGGSVLSTWTGQVTDLDLRHCLQKIQTANPGFPVQTSFRTLQEKARGGEHGFTGCSSGSRKRKKGSEVSGCSPKRPRPGLAAVASIGRRLQSDVQEDSLVEDTLWTDKFAPQHPSEVIGNASSLAKLHSWLKKWKLRADAEEKRETEGMKREENSHGSWDCGDFQGDSGSEKLPANAVLVTGPPGVGKTASVFACAQELGFKVLEVNCSSQRSGRSVLSQLTEATQSHLVEAPGEQPLRPAFFNNYSGAARKPPVPPGNALRPKTVPSTSRRRAVRRLKAKPNAVTLAHYFKMKDKADLLHFGGGASPSEKLGTGSSVCPETGPRGKKTATLLILFEEVDVVFEEDVGFLAAIKAFMTTTKRPVVLTTDDPAFKDTFDCNLDEILLRTPSAADVCSYLQLVCLAEGAWLRTDDAGELFQLTRGDVRRCLLQLQLWVRGGGTRRAAGTRREPVYSRDPQLHPHPTGCSTGMLGLHPVSPDDLLNLLKRRFWSEADTADLLKLLAESWRGDVPLLYLNLELLLSLGLEGCSGHWLEKAAGSRLQREPEPPRCDLATFGKSVRSISRLGRRKSGRTSSDLMDKPQGDGTRLRVDRRMDRLSALADVFDLVSFADAMLTGAGPATSGSSTPEAFVWTGAASKDGMLDKMSGEDREGRSRETMVDIRAAVEGLGHHHFWGKVSEFWTSAQKEADDKHQRPMDGLLTSPPGRQSLSLTFQPRSGSQRRYRRSRAVQSRKMFGLLGNRRAIFVDYVPTLRSICRSLDAQGTKGEAARSHPGLPRSTVKLLSEDFLS